MNDYSSPDSSAPSPSIEAVLSLYRRIYVLRHQGRSNDADTLHRTQFQPTLHDIKHSGHFHEGDLENRFKLEKRRLEDAALLADLVASMIQSPPRPESDELPSSPMEETPPKAPSAASPPDGSEVHPAPIAAFIDDMLSQNKSPGNRSTGSVADRQ